MIHAGGAGAAFQLTHAGMWAAKHQRAIGGAPFASSFSVDAPLCEYRSPNRQECPAEGDRIREVAAAYGDAARRAKAAGDRAKARCVSCNKCVLRFYLEGKPIRCPFEP
ncbi:MAG: hypothetical protein KA419_12490 [Acidobacteria bacterium]|nr:hypothetical protein [Acidobacteriota bacterium]